MRWYRQIAVFRRHELELAQVAGVDLQQAFVVSARFFVHQVLTENAWRAAQILSADRSALRSHSCVALSSERQGGDYCPKPALSSAESTRADISIASKERTFLLRCDTQRNRVRAESVGNG